MVLLHGFSERVRTLNNDLGGGPRRAGRVPRLADVAATVALVDGGEPQEAAGRVHAHRQPRLALLRPGRGAGLFLSCHQIKRKLRGDHSGR